MSKYEKVAWVMAFTGAVIVYYISNRLFGMITIEDGILTTTPGLLALAIKVILMAGAAEFACEMIRYPWRKDLRGEEEIVMDERDRAIRHKAAYFSLMVLTPLIFGLTGSLLFSKIATIDAIDTGLLWVGAIYVVNIAWAVRHVTEVFLYRRGY
ncbi:DUF2178 domain-containing protein [Kordiimonas aestuarii]|uniref:DUF2178 domain-containing protein n=1 Tax=Kordiimonas aestuarii TaxID=1005925 RepID=UPI0021D14909|nr:DUF2178 domain-containing protein [Kordiimonas aestuarii]